MALTACGAVALVARTATSPCWRPRRASPVGTAFACSSPERASFSGGRRGFARSVEVRVCKERIAARARDSNGMLRNSARRGARRLQARGTCCDSGPGREERSAPTESTTMTAAPETKAAVISASRIGEGAAGRSPVRRKRGRGAQAPLTKEAVGDAFGRKFRDAT